MARRRINLQAKGTNRRVRRTDRPSLGDTLKQARRRTQDIQNIRVGRRSGMSAQAAIASSAERFICADDFHIPWPNRLLRWMCALFILLPLCMVTVLTMIKLLSDVEILYQLYRTTEFVCFVVGIALMISWFFSGLLAEKFLYLYVLGHELTHAFFVYFCFGRISDMRVSTQGGYVMTNKSNLLIALSPYFVPFWSVILLSAYGALTAFTRIPYADLGLLVLLGGSWCFHVVWTIWMIPKDQPDLKEHGTFFSLMIIIFCNLILLVAMVSAASPALNLTEFGYTWGNIVVDLLQAGWTHGKAFLLKELGF